MNQINITEEIQDIKTNIKNLEQLVLSLHQKIDILVNSTNHINNSCEKMNDHVEFVETTYSSIRAPLNFVKNKIENIMGYGNKTELPAIKYRYNQFMTTCENENNEFDDTLDEDI